MAEARTGGPDFGSTFELLGRKHVIPILYNLFRQSPLSFGELRALVDASPATLTERLRDLEEFGLIERKALAVIPRRVEYALTPMMRDFEPVWRQLIVWRGRHPPGGRTKSSRAS